MWKVRQALGCRCGDLIRRRLILGGSRWVARLPDLGSLAFTTTDRSYQMEGITVESNTKKKQSNKKKQENQRGHQRGLKSRQARKGRRRREHRAAPTCLNGREARRLKRQNLGSSKAFGQKQRSAGEGRQKQERRERKGGPTRSWIKW
ncbi:hypothetical protein SLEP1_g1729 [Rubroshorea leprosula]|uniref:Uncharacterized protein n=1 Tax=Rubroshorea leprosula TaxID=152421 RepID=A0AAV5HP96_9ROSI|nr:hypothetical protein SLEP1_g1729 [Rubroshorea leprosula]